MAQQSEKKHLSPEISDALGIIRKAIEDGDITFEEVLVRLREQRIDLQGVLSQEQSAELSSEKLENRTDQLIASWTYIRQREAGVDFQKRLKNFGLDEVDKEKIGKVILNRLQSLLDEEAEIDRIVRLVSLLHDYFPASVGGGRFTGMREVPEIRSLLLGRLLSESQLPGFKITDTSETGDPWSVANITLHYLALRLLAIQYFSLEENDSENLTSERLTELFQDYIQGLMS